MSQEQIEILKVENISKSFSKIKIIENLTFFLYEKEILGILGFSGEGKSTLLNILTGIEKINSGNISYLSKSRFKSINSLSFKFLRSLIGYSTQEPSFYDELTVTDNLIYFGTLLNINKKEINKKIEGLLKIFNLENAKDQKASKLSVGMKKRLDFACALIHEPQILILDEPTANLDFKLRDEIIEYIKKVKEIGVSIIYVSHFIEEIEEVSDRILFINKNKHIILNNKNFKSNNLKNEFLNFVEETKKQEEIENKKKQKELEEKKEQKKNKKKNSLENKVENIEKLKNLAKKENKNQKEENNKNK